MKRGHLPPCPSWRLWAVSGAVGLLDATWLPFSRLTLDAQGLFFWAAIGAVCIAWYCAGHFIRLGDGPRLLAIGFAFIWVSHKFATLFVQLVMTLPVPMADSLLAQWDRALGFDWLEYLSWVAARPWVVRALPWIYSALMPAALVAFIVLHFLGRRERVSEYLALSFIGVIIAIVVGAAFPAMGTMTYFHPPGALIATFPAQTGTQWVQRLAELRSGVPVGITGMSGLISFPSYHVALAMIIAWCFRGFRFVFPICAIFVLGTAASALIVGGHYLVDLIAGAALACIVITAGTARRTLATAPTAAK